MKFDRLLNVLRGDAKKSIKGIDINGMFYASVLKSIR